MFQVAVLYNHPEDPARFDEHYDGVHAPLAGTIPGLQRYTVTRPGPGPDGTLPPYYLVASKSEAVAVSVASTQVAKTEIFSAVRRYWWRRRRGRPAARDVECGKRAKGAVHQRARP